MKNYFFLILLLLLTFSSCLEEKEVDCSGFQGSIIEQILINHDAPDLAADLETFNNSRGGVVRLLYTNFMGQNFARLGGNYSESKALSQIEQRGNIEIGNEQISKIVNGNAFTVDSHDSVVISVFDGEIHPYTQKNYADNGIINQFNVKMPEAFFTNNQVTTLNIDSLGNIQMNWPSNGSQNDYVYLVIYAANDLGNPQIAKNAPYYLVKKVPDSGNYILDAAEIADMPYNTRYYLYLVRYSHALYNDARMSSKKNLFFALSSTMTIQRKR